MNSHSKIDFNTTFKKFGGEKINNTIEYLNEYIKKEPKGTITIGCDSVQSKKYTIYALTIVLYNKDIRNGAHVIFTRAYLDKIKTHDERLYKEAHFLYELGEFLSENLNNYERQDLTDEELKKYKYHLYRCDGLYSHVPPHNELEFINNIVLSEADRNMGYKQIDVHVDFNPLPGDLIKSNDTSKVKNKSYTAYKNYVPWLRGMGYRTWAKPYSWASTSAADLLLK